MKIIVLLLTLLLSASPAYSFGFIGGIGTAQTAHSSEHEVGGSDLLDHDSLPGYVSNQHLAPRQAVNCSTETGGVTGEECQQTADNTLYKCESGPCNGSGWVSYGGGTTPTLDQVFDQGKTIDGADSEINSLQVGDATDKVKIWVTSSVGTIKGPTGANLIIKRNIEIHTAATVTLTGNNCTNISHYNNDADALDITLCAPSGGEFLEIHDDAGGVVTLDPADGVDTIILNGTSIGAGAEIDSGGNRGDRIALEAKDANTWIATTLNGSWTASGGGSLSFDVATGSYAGNTDDDRNVSVSPSFAIKVLIIKASSASEGVISFTSMTGESAKEFTSSGSEFTNCIQSMGTATFQVGTDARCNSSGVTYHYIALGDGADSQFSEGTYTGDGVDDRDIVISPAFQPKLCTVIAETASDAGVLRTSSNSGDQACRLNNFNCTTNTIQGFNANGFQVGTSSRVNTLNVEYSYFCIKDAVNNLAVDSYAGDTNDDRNITSSGFGTPVWFMSIPNSTTYPGFRFDSESGDNSFSNGGSEASDIVQQFITDGVEIGTNDSVNENTTTHFWWAVK